MTVVQTLVEGLNQIFLRAEVVVGFTERHARLLCDGAHRRFVVPTLAKHLEGSLEDQRFGLIAFDSLRGLLFVLRSHRASDPASPAARLIWYRFWEIKETTRLVVGSSSGAARRYDQSRYRGSAQSTMSHAFG